METRTIGIWSTALTAFFGLGYILALILTLTGVLSSPYDVIWQVTPSIFLAPAFMVMIISVHYATGQKIETGIASAFAILYVALAGMVYITVLGVSAPHMLAGTQLPGFMFVEGSFLQVVDALGYAFMSMAALFAGFAFKGFAKFSLIAHGVVAPIILTIVFVPSLLPLGGLWAITFVMMCVALLKWWY